MSDNELDNLFKEAADGFKAPNDPSAWQTMSSKLDQAAVTTSFWNWKTISSFTVLGVTSVALVLYLSEPGSTPEKIAATDISLDQVIKKEPADNKSTSSDKETSSTNLKSENQLVAGESDQARSDESKDKSEASLTTKRNREQIENSVGVETRTTKQNSLPSKQVIDEQNQVSVTTNQVNTDDVATNAENKSTQPTLIAGVAVTEKSLDSKNLDSPVKQNQAAVTTDSVNNNEVIPRSENRSPNTPLIAGVVVTEKSLNPKNSGSVMSETNSDQPSANTKATNAQTTTHVQAESFTVGADSLKKPDEEKKAVTENNLLSKTEKEPEDQDTKTESLNRFAVKLVVAPDYTTVKSATPNSLGINYGALFEYRINNHWSVATGGIWSKKIYSAYDVEYSGYNADWVDGDCRMWDIPINVYYNFTSSKPFSFYASLGFSSYLMNEENYVYYVETSYGTYDYEKQVKGENNEWFKTLNISMGMQFRMSQQFSFQFEPTLKAPLAGVGEGEVSLVSLGAFFNLRYEIPINKTRSNDD